MSQFVKMWREQGKEQREKTEERDLQVFFEGVEEKTMVWDVGEERVEDVPIHVARMDHDEPAVCMLISGRVPMD